MDIKKAEFLTSSSVPTQCPDPDRPEYAFIGRSNVGKSSLINMICNKSALAKTSSTPGKTQLINHFTINDTWYLVDLPGYGYAKVSKTQRKSFKLLIENYLRHRSNLMCLFVLVDSRHKPQNADLEFMRQMGEWGIPFVIVLTKLDKLKASEKEINIANYKKALLEEWEELPQIFVTSAKKGEGRDEILHFIDQVSQQW
ncbi:GTP-binding protein [Saccharicrinis carchari]|uniref:Probable GTP-binding protein EngB n=1 Tax=Saccharicrinis carchari TaxID=1168039 RepID=A0A521CNF8_SACCC|nr:ribosome biogenesis GTP-binding protein YihA/YsxC [Saccharicrinis carchari]SMO60987.1 GTP-binding protein [Saccharicrinis carchari]